MLSLPVDRLNWNRLDAHANLEYTSDIAKFVVCPQLIDINFRKFHSLGKKLQQLHYSNFHHSMLWLGGITHMDGKWMVWHEFGNKWLLCMVTIAGDGGGSCYQLVPNIIYVIRISVANVVSFHNSGINIERLHLLKFLQELEQKRHVSLQVWYCVKTIGTQDSAFFFARRNTGAKWVKYVPEFCQVRLS